MFNAASYISYKTQIYSPIYDSYHGDVCAIIDFEEYKTITQAI